MPRIITAIIALPILIASILIPGCSRVCGASGCGNDVGALRVYVLAKEGSKADAAPATGSAALFTVFYFASLTRGKG